MAVDFVAIAALRHVGVPRRDSVWLGAVHQPSGAEARCRRQRGELPSGLAPPAVVAHAVACRWTRHCRETRDSIIRTHVSGTIEADSGDNSDYSSASQEQRTHSGHTRRLQSPRRKCTVRHCCRFPGRRHIQRLSLSSVRAHRRQRDSSAPPQCLTSRPHRVRTGRRREVRDVVCLRLFEPRSALRTLTRYAVGSVEAVVALADVVWRSRARPAVAAPSAGCAPSQATATVVPAVVDGSLSAAT